MTPFQALVLGILQGLTEFLPVSSSGHLALAHWAFGWTFESAEFDKAFDAALHLGTFAGVAAYFWRELARIARALPLGVIRRDLSEPDARLGLCITVATLPGVVAGVALETFIQEELGAPWIVATMLIVFGVVLGIADRLGRKNRSFDSIALMDAALIGLAQMLSLSPGVSRSGVTISAGLGRGLDREAAARFSFLLLVPITAGAGTYKVAKVVTGGMPPGMGTAFGVGMVAAAVTSFFAVWFLLRLVRTYSYMPFVIYRVGLGLAVLGAVAFG